MDSWQQAQDFHGLLHAVIALLVVAFLLELLTFFIVVVAFLLQHISYPTSKLLPLL